MADLPEIDEFTAGVYQWEITDPAEAGPDGILNTPLKALVNRTLWLKNKLAAQSFFPGELKWLNGVTSGFITTNFPSGLGTGVYTGWAIANGANGTTDMGGKVAVAYGNTFSTINATGGAVNHTLSVEEIPSHRHEIPIDTFDGHEGGSERMLGNGFNGSTYTGYSGGGQAHNNMQPYRVVLCIQKI